MKVNSLDALSVYQRSTFFLSLFNQAVEEAKKQNKKLGLPNDFVISGKRYYELPNGEITDINPLADWKPDQKA